MTLKREERTQVFLKNILALAFFISFPSIHHLSKQNTVLSSPSSFQ